MHGAEGFATRESGFAARVRRGSKDAASAGVAARGLEGRAPSAGGFPAPGALNASPGASARSDGPRDARQSRIKRLAAVAATSLAVAFLSIAYGAWSATSSRAAVEEATTGAASTLVAAVDIRAGDVLSSGLLRTQQVPQAFRSDAALGQEALADDGGVIGGRALVDIPVGAQIAASFVTGPAGGGRLAATLSSGMEGVTVAVDAETGLAGGIRLYDTVRVVSAEGASAGASLLTTLCPRARVVAVGEGSAESGGTYASVTVEVTPAQADAVREAQYAGRVSLILVASQDALDAEGPGMSDAAQPAFEEGAAHG